MNIQPRFTPPEPYRYKSAKSELTATYQVGNQKIVVSTLLGLTHQGAAAVGIKGGNVMTINMPIKHTPPDVSTEPCVYIVDDDYAVRDGLKMIIDTTGLACQTFESAEDFLLAYSPDMSGCLLLDINMPGMSGLELQDELIRRNSHLPIMFLTTYSDTLMKVRAIKAGAVDFLTKPVSSKLLIERILAVL